MTELSFRLRHQIRLFERRCATIQNKAETLSSDIMATFGADSTVSDFADNVVHQAEELAGALARLPADIEAGKLP